MENPGVLLNRAREFRHFRGISEPPAQQHAEGDVQRPAPVHQSSHASYTALMRSHDRMRTRHIAGQSKGNGA